MKQEHLYTLSEKHVHRVLDLTETLKGTVVMVSQQCPAVTCHDPVKCCCGQSISSSVTQLIHT